MIKLGAKLWSINSDSFRYALDYYKQGKFDFIELYVVPGSFNENKLAILKEIPVIIHCTHMSHNFNLMVEKEENFKVFEEVKKFADFFNSKYIIIHPGVGGNFSILEKNISQINDKRLVFENMPYKALVGGFCYGHSIDQIKKILNLGPGFCLDFGHAVKSAISQGIEYGEFIGELMKLNPIYFHFSDGATDIEEDEHLNLGEGDYDLKFMKSLVENQNEGFLVMETPKIDNNLKNDIGNLEYFKNL